MKPEVHPSEIRILVVDDNPDILNSTARLLGKAGYTVDQAASGEAAVASALEHRPNLLLLDRDMPGMDGIEVCRRIRTDPALAGVFVIFVSGINVATEEQSEGLESGADGYITRPIANRELLARVDAYVRILFLNRKLQQRVEELKQAGEAARQSRQASLNLMEEAVTARDRAETANQELQKEITIRQAHEREIERLSRLYATLSQVNQAIVRTPSRADLLGAICRIAIEYAGYKLAWIGRIDPQTQRVMPLARAGKAAAYVEEIKVYADERPEGQGPGGICIREDQPSVFNDLLNAPAGQPWHVAAQAHGLRSLAAFPIHFQGRVWGVLSVYDGEVGVFQDREIALLVEATKDISFALENVEREGQRQRAEAALLRQQQLLDETQQISKVGGWEYAVATGRITWTAEMFRIHGVANDYNPSPIQNEAIEFYAPADKQRVAAAFQQALETGEPFELEMELITPAGAKKWVRTEGQTERAEGKIVRVFGNVMDVTERKRAENQVLHDSARFRSLANLLQFRGATTQEFLDFALAESLALTGSRFGYIYLYHEDRKQFVLNTWSKEVMQECAVANPETCYELDQTGIWGEAVRQRRPILLNDFAEANPHKKGYPEGHVKLERFLTLPIFSDDHIVAVVGAANKPTDYEERDIEQLRLLMDAVWKVVERQRAEAALRASEASLIHAQQIARIGNWDWNIVTDELYWSAQVFALFGISETEADRTYERFLHGVHPEDRERAHQAVQDTLAGRAPYNIEHRVLWPDGTVRVMHERGEVERDAEGRALHMTGTVQDITERKQAEAAVQLHQERLRRTQTVGQVGSWEYNLESGKIWGSDEGFRIFGLPYANEDVAIEIVEACIPERARVQQALRDLIAHGQRYNLEYEVRPANGAAPRIVNSIAELVQDESGKPLKVVGAILDITERKQAEAALRESEEQFRALAEAIPQLAWIARADGYIYWYNQRWYDYTGTTPAQMEGWGWQSVHDPQVLPKIMEQWKNGIASGQLVEMEFPLRGADGQFRTFLTRVQPLKNAAGQVLQWFGTNTDVDELKRTEAALRGSEERFRRAVVDSPFPILLHAEDGAIIQASNSWCDITGYSREELRTIGDWTERAYGERKQQVQSEIEALYGMKEFKQEGDYSIRTKSGETRIWGFSSGPLGQLPDGRRLVMSIAMDVTERRQAEAEVKTLNAELEQRVRDRTQQLEAANKELEAFSYSVSHDLRTPLRAIDGYGRMLVEDHAGCLDMEGRRLLGVISGETRRMGQLIDDLLAFARLGRKSLEISSLDMTALIQSFFQEQAAQCPERRLQLELATLPPACGDPAMFGVVWNNLLSNAIKFTRHQERAVIEIGCCPDGEQLVYFVKDNGAGFDMKYADKLFGVFQRLHTAEEFAGTGVGLALVQRVIHRHGGRVWAEAKVNAGATFYFSLPKRKENHETSK